MHLLAPRILLAFLALALASACAPEITSPGTATGTEGEPFSYQITATRSPTEFSASVPPPAGLAVATDIGLISGTPSEAGTFSVQIAARNASGEGRGMVELTIAPGVPPPDPGHAVVDDKELFITNAAVLSDARAQAGGAWHVRSALQRIAGAGVDVDAFAAAWFATWNTNTSLPGVNDSFGQRPTVATALQDAWNADRIALIAIVNRLDLTRHPNGDITQPPDALGEGRFIYEVRDAGGQSLPFTLIFEYGLPAPSGNLSDEVRRWAKAWHALGRAELGGPTDFPPAYLAELQTITDEYSAHGTLNQIRTNEFVASPWEMREFHFVGGATPRLEQVPVRITPALAHNNGAALGAFIDANEQAILDSGVSSLPASLQGAVAPVPSTGPTPTFRWTAPANSARATFILSFDTCNGCHAGDTGTAFQHIGQRAPAGSAFLNGSIPLAHPLPGSTTPDHDEMALRADLLAQYAQDVPPARAARFTPDVLSSILRGRANRPH
jgi:hypothetical protein